MDMTLWGALIVLLAIFFALRKLMKKLIGGRVAPGGVYVRKAFLTDGERAFLSQLQGFMPDGDSVMAKVRVVDLVEVNPKQAIDATMRLRFLKPLAHWHADFVWLDPQLRVKAVIMLDESTHQLKKRLRLDKPFHQAMAQAGIRVLRVNSFTDFTEQARHCDAL